MQINVPKVNHKRPMFGVEKSQVTSYLTNEDASQQDDNSPIRGKEGVMRLRGVSHANSPMNGVRNSREDFGVHVRTRRDVDHLRFPSHRQQKNGKQPVLNIVGMEIPDHGA